MLGENNHSTTINNGADCYISGDMHDIHYPMPGIHENNIENADIKT